MPVLQRVTKTSTDEDGDVDRFVQLAKENWSEYLDLIADQQNEEEFWTADDENELNESEIDEAASRGTRNRSVDDSPGLF